MDLPSPPNSLLAPGRVLIDDRPVGDYDRKWLKQRVALVSQEPVLYARSIRRWGPGRSPLGVGWGGGGKPSTGAGA